VTVPDVPSLKADCNRPNAVRSVQDTKVLSLLLKWLSVNTKSSFVSCCDMLLVEKLLKNAFHDLQEATSSL
jgi:hypothetical protein